MNYLLLILVLSLSFKKIRLLDLFGGLIVKKINESFCECPGRFRKG